MVHFGLHDFGRLHYALIHLHHMHPDTTLYTLYTLNTAHLDTIRMKEDRSVRESSGKRFNDEVKRLSCPWFNLLSLYRSLESLRNGISIEYITEMQREATRQLEAIIKDVGIAFERSYHEDLDDVLNEGGRIIRPIFEYQSTPRHRTALFQ